MSEQDDIIALKDITNLSQLFCTRVRRSANRVAYQYYDTITQAWQELTWAEMANHVARWQAALKNEDLSPGDRVGLMLSNCPSWVMFEQAALGLGLIVIPLYTNDRAENISYIINDAQISVLLLETADQWAGLRLHAKEAKSLSRILCMQAIDNPQDNRLLHVDSWLPDKTIRYPLHELKVHKSSLATIVYTSGTTGKPKGVMLNHQNIFWDAYAGIQTVKVYSSDIFLSFLPLSHMFERTVGYYLPIICGSKVCYARSIELLADDLMQIKPTVLITVPRIFERVYNKIQVQLNAKSRFTRKLFELAVNIGWLRFCIQQGKRSLHPALLLWPVLKLLVARKITKKLGGRLRLAVSGGAPLGFEVARTFIGLGLTISQGYGLTEASPVISTNKLEDNDPASIGQALPGIETRLGNEDELLVRGPCVMMGYWNQEEATRQAIDPDGWLHTGDKARIENDHIYITGRLKEILVLSNGEKVPPANIEMTICSDPLFEQALVIGEQKPYLTAIIVVNRDEWRKQAAQIGVTSDTDMLNHPSVHEFVLERVHAAMTTFPGYARIYRVYITDTCWNIDNGLVTPTLKLKRHIIMEKYTEQIAQMYEGH